MDETKVTFLDQFAAKMANDTFVKLTLGKKRGGDELLKKIYVTPVELRGSRELSFLYRYETRDETKNFSFDKGVSIVSDLLGSDFLSAHLFGTDGNVELAYSRKLKARLSSSKPSFKKVGDTGHDKQKKRFIEVNDNAYLRALGVVTADGRIAKKKEKKFRQINKFIEVVDAIIRSSNLTDKDTISVVDMGAGKGYLTFALYDYLVNTLKKKAVVVGVEARAEIVESCNGIAEEVGFEGLSFAKGYINDYKIDKVDVLIALHACDTATDDAMFQGVKAEAEVIVCSPCCHKQIATQLSSKDANSQLISFGILKEQQATLVTDGLRALLLKSQGYKTNVFEFISTEHTGKNIMISAVKNSRDCNKEAVYSDVDQLKVQWGISHQHLDGLLRKV